MTTLAMASRLSSMTTRVFSSDSSRTSVMSVMILFVDQLGDAVDQLGAVHVEGNFRDDDLFLAALEFLDAELGRGL